MILAEMSLFILLWEMFTRGLVCARLPFTPCGLNNICNLLQMAKLLSSLLSIMKEVSLKEGQVAGLKPGSGSCSWPLGLPSQDRAGSQPEKHGEKMERVEVCVAVQCEMGQVWHHDVTGWCPASRLMNTVPQMGPHIPLATHGGNHRGGGRVILAVPTPTRELTHAKPVSSLRYFSSEFTNPEASVTPTKKMLRFSPAWTQQPYSVRGEPGTPPRGLLTHRAGLHSSGFDFRPIAPCESPAKYYDGGSQP